MQRVIGIGWCILFDNSMLESMIWKMDALLCERGFEATQQSPESERDYLTNYSVERDQDHSQEFGATGYISSLTSLGHGQGWHYDIICLNRVSHPEEHVRCYICVGSNDNEVVCG